MVNLLPTIRLAQSILKRKFPSVDTPLKKDPLKNISPGAFFGILRYVFIYLLFFCEFYAVRTLQMK